jgi:hypothetical protein
MATDVLALDGSNVAMVQKCSNHRPANMQQMITPTNKDLFTLKVDTGAIWILLEAYDIANQTRDIHPSTKMDEINMALHVSFEPKITKRSCRV